MLVPDPFFRSDSYYFWVRSGSIVYWMVGFGKFQLGSVTLPKRQTPEM